MKEPRAKDGRAQYLTDNMDRLAKRDRILTNNPVIMQGLGIAPIVIPDTNVKNALVLAVAVILLLTPTRLIAAALSRRMGLKTRAVIFVLTAGLVYVGVAFLADYFFGAGAVNVGIYLPLLIMEPLVLKRYESDTPEHPAASLKKGLSTTFGFCLVLILIGFLRELLGTGSVWGVEVLRFSLFPLASVPAGGFILLGLVAAVWRGAVAAFLHSMRREVREEP